MKNSETLQLILAANILVAFIGFVFLVACWRLFGILRSFRDRALALELELRKLTAPASRIDSMLSEFQDDVAATGYGQDEVDGDPSNRFPER